MGAAPRQFHPFNRCSAGQAVFAGSTVDSGLASVVSIDAFQITEVAEGGSAHANADLQHMNQAVAEFLQLLATETTSGCVWCDPGDEQALVGIDVASACHQGLIQERRFDGPCGSFQFALKVAGAEGITEWFWTQSFQASDHGVDGGAIGHPPHFAEAAHVDETQFLTLLVPETGTGVFAGITGLVMPLELAGHAEMNPPDAAGSMRPLLMERGH